MKKKAAKTAKHRKLTKSSGLRRKRAPGQPPPPTPAASTSSVSVTVPTDVSRASPVDLSRSMATIAAVKLRSSVRAAGLPPPAVTFEPVKVAELIESRRAHVASLANLALVTSRALFELYEYDAEEPALWDCCGLVCELLRSTQDALMSLGMVSHDAEPRRRSEDIATGCERQQQWLRPSVQVVRAIIHILIEVKPNDHGEVLPALRHLESGIAYVVEGLGEIIELCPRRARPRSAP